MIEFKNVDVVFGEQPERALPLIDENISLQEIKDSMGLTTAVRSANLKVNKGEICVLMGLSGSGKSSLLRTANGLNPITRGQILIETEDGIKDFHALNESERRDARMNTITMVFQKFALMPWLTVAENVGFGLEQKGLDKKTIRKKVTHQLELVGLAEWADKRPDELSGGMQQRVGLARAFAMETDIILMDEPFSALDPLIRSQLQDELLRLQAQLNKTVIFVSHDLDEALKLGNHLAIMTDGEIVQHDTPENIVLNPANDYVRDFVAHTNPVHVVNAKALMTPLSQFKEVDNRLLLSKRSDCWLEMDTEAQEYHLQYGDGRRLNVISWSGEDPIESLASLPVCVNANTKMYDVMALRYQTGHGVLVADNQGKVLGYIGDRDIYHAMLGKLIADD